MPEIIRTKERVYRPDEYSSDDDRSSSYGHSRHSNNGGYKTVKTYRVTPTRSRVVEDIDDDRVSRRGNYSSRLEVDRIQEVDRIERPRSALEYRDSGRDRNTSRTIVYERERSPEPRSARPWEREDRPWEREKETDVVRIERRHREREEEPAEYERVTRETEYYTRPEPVPQPIVIRERAPEPQKIIVETAPAPQSYEIVRREEIIDNRQVAPPRRQEDEYYYRRDVREVEPRGEVARYDRRRDHSESGGSDSEVYVRRERRVVRSRSRSHSPNHKLHLAEGALAGGAAAALLANHRNKTGHGSEHRGRKVAGGAALGALGAELVTRARSRYRDSSRGRDRSRSRSSSRGHDHHTKLKTGLAIAAAAVAAAAAGKYISSRNERKEEAARGRSRTRTVSRRRRYSSDEAEAALEKHSDPKHRAATMAKVGAGAAAVAGVVEHFRSKSQGRSKSRLRTGGVIAATGVAGAALAGVYEARKAKQDAAAVDEHRRHRSRSHSRARSLVYSDPGVDPELGMVEYGTNPVYTGQRDAYGYDPAAAAAERSRERRASRSRSRSRVRDIASGALATGAAAIGINQYQKRKERKAEERERRRHYEEEAPRDNYYAHESYDDGYSPSPPHASGGAYYPETNEFPPPPVPQAGYPQHPADSVPNVNEYPPHPPYDPAHHPPYNPADFPGGPPQRPPVNPYYNVPREARDGGNVSSTTPFAPLAKTPVPRSMYNIADDEEARRLASPTTTSSTLSSTPPHSPPPDPNVPHNKSVTFAPLSPTSTRTLKTSQRQRRASDPSADRPHIPSRHRRRHRNASRSPSPDSEDEVEVLPDRFDKYGSPFDENSLHRPRETEMVERIVHDFGDVLEGRQSWRHLLRGFFEEAGAASGGGRRK